MKKQEQSPKPSTIQGEGEKTFSQHLNDSLFSALPQSRQPTVTQQGNAEDMQAKLLDIHSNLLLGNVVEANRITLLLIKFLDKSSEPTEV